MNEISILFTTDKKIHKLNKAYRNKDKPTDVLSFSQIEGIKNFFSFSLGDLVISLDTAKKQAKEYKNTFNQEILRLLIHGMLHLIGYDHENVTANEAAKMRRLEKKLFLKFYDSV